MEKSYCTLFQSGQKVTIPGDYQVVGVDPIHNQTESITRVLLPGDLFPDYQGRQVCWFLIAARQQQAAEPALVKPWQTPTSK